jgi:phage FluMu gp28-like protein
MGDLLTTVSRPLLLPYQVRWAKDRRRMKIAMFARQTGKTFTTTYEIVDRNVEASIVGRRDPWVILSRGERQAKEAMDEGVKRHAAAYGLAFQDVGAYDWKDDVGCSHTAFEVAFGDSRVTALPANPDTARGFSRNVFLDEFAIHKNPREIWGALYPIISAGWDIRVTSTPKGRQGKFYELMTGNDEVWSRHVVDIYQAVAEGLPRDIDELRAGLADDELWAQEFELKWLDEASAWLPYELISSCEDTAAGDPDRYQGGVCFIGWDIAVRGDLSVIWVLEQVGDVLWTREIVEMRRLPLTEQYDIFDDVMHRYRVGRACLDQTGLGEGPVAEMQRRHGALRVEGVLFTPANKLVLATTGKQHFEDRTIRIPEGDVALRADLHKLRRVASATGAPRFVAERDDDHADRTWAAFLGIHAAGDGPPEYAYTPAPRAIERDRSFWTGEDDDEPVRAGRTLW